MHYVQLVRHFESVLMHVNFVSSTFMSSTLLERKSPRWILLGMTAEGFGSDTTNNCYSRQQPLQCEHGSTRKFQDHLAIWCTVSTQDRCTSC